MEERFSCDCKGCKSACRVKPGWMLPGEAEKIADHLGLTMQNLFDNCLLVDYYLGYEDGHKYLLAPAIKGKPVGTMMHADPRGTCIFFDDKTEHCQIHEVAPYECRTMNHTESHEEISNKHRWVAEQWNNEKDYKQITKLLKEEPSVPEMDMGTLLDIYTSLFK